MPHRIDSQGRWNLEFGGLGEFGVRVLRLGKRLGPQDGAQVVVEPGILQPAVPRPRIKQLARLDDTRPRRGKILAKDVNPAALQQNTMNVQRLLDLPPVPFGVAEALVGVVQRLDRQAEQAEVQPAA
jgi:hypothetical protein